MNFIRFIKESFQIVIKGSKRYYVWLAFLSILIIWGVSGYIQQLKHGLTVTNMQDPISWGFYIGNFTFLVGVAAAAVMLVIPAYIYNWKPLKEVVLFGELLAICAMIMVILFVIVDVRRQHLGRHRGDRFQRVVYFSHCGSFAVLTAC